MAKNFLDSDVDYWNISKTIKDLYLSDASVNMLLDFERVMDEVDIYAFENWDIGELVDGPNIGRYNVTCTFLWLAKNMPDPRGAKRLIPFDCTVRYKKSKMEIPIKVKSYDDFVEGTKKPKLISKDIWLVEITIPKDLMTDVKVGSTELEGEDIDLDDLNQSYEEDLHNAQNENN